MPIYEYEHEGDGCALGKYFEQRQSIKDEPLKQCPQCGEAVRKLISRPNIGWAAPSDKQLAEKGFTKLVRKDKGVYENVTAGKKQQRTYQLDD